MDIAVPLPSILNVEQGRFSVVLFSQPDCEFCAEVREHYLRPMLLAHPRQMTVAEANIELTAPIRDWSGKDVPQRDFARLEGARFAPTVMFLDGQGKPVADPIVGLSKDYFGAYLEQRLQIARKAVGKGRIN